MEENTGHAGHLLAASNRTSAQRPALQARPDLSRFQLEMTPGSGPQCQWRTRMEKDGETPGGFSMPRPGVGNYGGEKPISLDPSSAARGTGPHPAGRGVLPRRRPIKCKAQRRPPALNSVGKGLADSSEHHNFHGLVETLFWRLKGEHSTRAGLQCARLGLHKHTRTHTHTKPPNSWGEGCSLHHVTMATAYLTFESK